ncbi:MAG: glycosyltransferase family 4 protein [Pseudomonadota bacterium]
MTEAVFAIPGDKDRRTGGFIYEATVLRVLNEIGCATAHLELPDSFPDPTSEDMIKTLRCLTEVPVDRPIILDGLVFGTIDPEGLSKVRAPVIAMVHHPLGLEVGLRPERADFLRSNEAAALVYADHVIVPSPETARVLTENFGADRERITIAPPGFTRPDVDRTPRSPPLILSVGLLAPRKGHDVLLDALAQLSDLPWQAQIIGKTHDIATERSLRRQREHLGLEARVSFEGEVSAQALTASFNAASIFALATRYEGYGMVLGEAMLHALPIVSCRAGAVPDTLGDAGLLVPPENSRAFAHALRRLLVEPETAQHQSALSLERSTHLPSWQDTATIFAHVIRRLR